MSAYVVHIVNKRHNNTYKNITIFHLSKITDNKKQKNKKSISDIQHRQIARFVMNRVRDTMSLLIS